jgi:hypothetical protein
MDTPHFLKNNTKTSIAIVLVFVIGLVYFLRSTPKTEVVDKIVPPVETGAVKEEWVSGGEFTYNGKPMHPLCVEQAFQLTADERTEPPKLSDCNQIPVVDDGIGPKVVKATNPTRDDNGLLSVTYTQVDTGVTDEYTFGYKVLGHTGNTFLIYTASSGGGSGIFEDLSILEKTNDVLLFKKFILGGDRCNDGYITATVSANTIAVTSAATAWKIITLGTGEYGTEFDFSKYKGLDSSATGCVGYTTYSYDPVTWERTFSNVSLGDFEIPRSDSSPIQKCFNALYDKTGAVKLSMEELKKFSDTFVRQCVK